MGTAVRLAAALSPQRADVSWLGLTAVLAGRAYRAMLLTWAAIALVPALFGWASHAIMTGSMEPMVSVGDVVVAREVAPDERIAVGRVYVFDDPASTADRTVVHRVVERRDDGDFTTAGDANAVTDALPLPRENVTARGILLVPLIGLPVVWAVEGAWALLGAWLVVTVLAFVAASRRVGGEPVRRRTGPRRRARHLVPTAALLIALPAGAAARPSIAEATFTARTDNGSSTWQAGRWLQPYVQAVLADSPSFLWLLDETGGPRVRDRSTHDSAGRYTDVGAYRQPGGLPNNFGYSVRLGPQGRIVDDGDATWAPNRFTLELWFRTTTTTGGRLMGFESSREETSYFSDRTVHMDDDGRIVYGAWESLGQSLVVSPRSYNDGQWHHLVVAAVPGFFRQEVTLYLDGQPVARDFGSFNLQYNGWWRVGGGTAPTGRTAPASVEFEGLIDNVAVYPSTLSAARVAEHYRVR